MNRRSTSMCGHIPSKVVMRLSRLICILALTLFAAAAVRSQTPSEPSLPYSPSLNLESIDKSIDPCVNLYQYSCGRWQKENPIPADQTSWSVYGKLYEDNLKFLRGILEQAAAQGAQRDAVTQKIGDFYAACVDETAIEKRGITPITTELERIAALKSVHDFAPLVAQLQLVTSGRSMLFVAVVPARIPTIPSRSSRLSIRAAWDFRIATTTPRTTRSRKRFASAMCNTSRNFSN